MKPAAEKKIMNAKQLGLFFGNLEAIQQLSHVSIVDELEI